MAHLKSVSSTQPSHSLIADHGHEQHSECVVRVAEHGQAAVAVDAFHVAAVVVAVDRLLYRLEFARDQMLVRQHAVFHLEANNESHCDLKCEPGNRDATVPSAALAIAAICERGACARSPASAPRPARTASSPCRSEACDPGTDDPENKQIVNYCEARCQDSLLLSANPASTVNARDRHHINCEMSVFQ